MHGHRHRVGCATGDGSLEGIVVVWSWAFAGSPLQVSGPAAGLAVIVLEAVQEFGLPTQGIMIFWRASSKWLPGSLVGRLPSGRAIGDLCHARRDWHLILGATTSWLMTLQGSGLTNLVTIPNAIIKAHTSGEYTPPSRRPCGCNYLAVLIGWNAIKTNCHLPF